MLGISGNYLMLEVYELISGDIDLEYAPCPGEERAIASFRGSEAWLCSSASRLLKVHLHIMLLAFILCAFFEEYTMIFLHRQP